MVHCKSSIFVFLILVICETTVLCDTRNITRTIKNDTIREKTLKRDKRFLLWTTSGVSKSVLGVAVPIATYDRVNWRSMAMSYNFQAQYIPIPSIIYPWTRFQRSMENRKKQYEQDGSYENDGSRELVYKSFELLMNRQGINGKQCLLRAICDAAYTPIKHVTVFDEILQLFLTPNENEVHNDYIDARLAGTYGIDCFTLYPECPKGSGLLDTISYFK